MQTSNRSPCPVHYTHLSGRETAPWTWGVGSFLCTCPLWVSLPHLKNKDVEVDLWTLGWNSLGCFEVLVLMERDDILLVTWELWQSGENSNTPAGTPSPGWNSTSKEAGGAKHVLLLLASWLAQATEYTGHRFPMWKVQDLVVFTVETKSSVCRPATYVAWPVW